MDLARSACYLEYAPCRVRCPSTAAHRGRPLARTGALHARFEDWVAWLASLHRPGGSELPASSGTAWAAWQAVYAELEARRRLEVHGVRPSASTRRRTRRATSTSRWSRPHRAASSGRTRAPARTSQPVPRRAHARAEARHRGGDRRRARWIRQLVKRRCPNARWVMDPFHVVQWMNDALDAVRCEEWNAPGPPRAAGPGPRASAAGLPKASCRPRRSGRSRRRRPPSRAAATPREEPRGPHRRPEGEARGAQEEGRLAAGQGLGAQGGPAGRLPGSRRLRGRRAVDDWMHRAPTARSQGRRRGEEGARRRDDIIAAVSSASATGRRGHQQQDQGDGEDGYGFRNTDNLVALLMLRCGDCQPQLPGRPVKARKKGVKGAKSVAA